MGKNPHSPIDLGGGVFAIRFKFYRVSELTMGRAVPKEFMRKIWDQGKVVRFAPEEPGKESTLRADAKVFEKMWPEQVAKLKSITKGQPLANFVLFRVKQKEKGKADDNDSME